MDTSAADVEERVWDKEQLMLTFTKQDGCGTELHHICAAAHSSLEAVRIYISMFPYCVRMKDDKGDLPIHIAIKRDDANVLIIAELLRAFPDSAKARDSNKCLPLFLACQQKRVNAGVLKQLLAAYPAAASTASYGCLALHQLCFRGNPSPESVRALLGAHTAAAKTPNSHGNLPIHYLCASQKPTVEAIRLLIKANPEGISSRNHVGLNPIDKALASGNTHGVEIIRYILRCTPEKVLTTEQHKLMRDINWGLRREAMLASYAPSEYHDRVNFLSFFHTACYGIWRDIMSYL